jgi:Carboxypeptidase regulatory-like domain
MLSNPWSLIEAAAARTPVILLFSILSTVAIQAQQVPRPSSVPTESGGVIEGTVTTQNATIALGGVRVSLSSDRTSEVATVLSEADGTFRFEGLAAGPYKVAAALEGFDVQSKSVTVSWNETAHVPLDLPLAMAQSINVVAQTESVVPSTGTLAPGEAITSRQLEEIGIVGGLHAALRLLVSVIEVPGGVAIKGGRPSQASVQLGPGMFVDPATGLSQVRLPDDAIDSVTVLPNPYAVEYGRFSSGLVLIQTRRAADRWKTRLNSLDPSFRTKRHEPLKIIGISSFAPRLETGGPLIKDRLFLQEAAQYRYRTSEVPSRPQEDLKTAHAFSSFTRLDANLSTRHALVAAGGLFPSVSSFATLGTFTPPNAAADLHSGVDALSVTERSLWSDALFSETTVEMNRYRSEVLPQSALPMELLPETTLGSFFNHQTRTTSTYQVIETLSGSRNGNGGLHFFKAGFDLLHSRFSGKSASAPVLIRRSDGRLVRRLDFGPPTAQSIDSTDVALFVQDRVQPSSRWFVEFGGRLDRDGVIRQINITPRVGTAVLLNTSGSAVLRSGFGFFYERTPSAAGAFNQYESFVETRYGEDGITPVGSAMLFHHTTAPELHTSRSLTWDLAYDHRLNSRWALHAGSVDRHGSHELLVEPIAGPSSTSELRLHSDGRSAYREIELGVHFTHGPLVDLNASYVRSYARADLNAFTTFFDSVLWPVVGVNQYAPARADAPHRLLARGRAMPTKSWLFVGVLDWRTGLPYSVVNEALDFVGTRNDRRFPNYLRLELGVERRIRLLKFRPWVGVRADNALNAFLPTDVQANISSPFFGSLYNSEYRQFRIQFRFER